MEVNKYVQRAKRVEKRINTYAQGTESFVINSINLLQEFLLEVNSKPKEIKKDESKKKGG